MKTKKTLGTRIVGIVPVIIFMILVFGIISITYSIITAEKAPQEELETVTEDIKLLEFDPESTFLRNAIISTEDRTFVWSNSKVEFIKTDSEKNFITYQLNQYDHMLEKKIHLNADGIKKYSKSYADAYSATLDIKN